MNMILISTSIHGKFDDPFRLHFFKASQGLPSNHHKGQLSTSVAMNTSFQTWPPSMRGVRNVPDDVASAYSSDVEQERRILDRDIGLDANITLWSKETLISCICGAPLDSHCSCLSTSLDFVPESDYFQEPPKQQTGLEVNYSETFFPTALQVQEDSRPVAPTRKEVRLPQMS